MRYKGLPEHARSQTTSMEGHHGGSEVARSGGRQCIVNRVPMGTNTTSSDQTYRMVQVRASLPAKGEGIKNKVPAPPLKRKVGSTFCRKKNMIIATFVVASSLKITLVDVSGKVSSKIQRKREISDPQIEESLVVAHARLRWFYSDWHN